MFRLSCAFAFIIFGLIYSIDADLSTMCQSDSQCNAGFCCMLGPYRYAGPECKPMQQKGDPCRVNAELLTNTTHYINNDEKIELKGVNYILCPCAEGLSCEPQQGICT